MTTCSPPPEGWLDVRVAGRWTAARETLVFELVDPSGGMLPPFDPGAYIDVLTPRGLVRPYSLCGAPADRQRYVIVVAKESGGRGGSVSLHEQVGLGDMLRIRRPLNEFALNAAATHSVLIAGGVGIAPLLSMAHALWARGAPFDLHYCARSAERAPFADRLACAAFASRVHCRWTESAGRLNFGGLLRCAPFGADVYVCGPAGFSSDATAAFLASGRPQERLHTETFLHTRDPRARASAVH